MRKWWRETEQSVQLEFARVSASGAVPIEVVAGHLHTDPGRADDEASTDSYPRVKKMFLDEAHHREYGRPWGMGKYIFEFAVEAGLRPEHRLLDFGCGALRFGNWVIPYLDAGNYFGVEAHLPSLEAAVTYEIPLHALEQRRPRLLWNEDFAFSHFGTTFDFIVDYSSAQRVKNPARRRKAFSNFGEVLVPGGRLLTSPKPEVPADTFSEAGLTLLRRHVQECLLLQGHDFKSHITWFEFVAG
jgi:SAM-dependent methyltransferase